MPPRSRARPVAKSRADRFLTHRAGSDVPDRAHVRNLESDAIKYFRQSLCVQRAGNEWGTRNDGPVQWIQMKHVEKLWSRNAIVATWFMPRRVSQPHAIVAILDRSRCPWARLFSPNRITCVICVRCGQKLHYVAWQKTTRQTCALLRAIESPVVANS
jgi:hypothetical protein